MFGKLNKNIGLSMIVISFVFLFEPSYALYDPLPDFIGYAVMCFALINLADINSQINDSLYGFGKALLVSLAKCAALIVLNKYFASDEMTVGVLIFAFVFAFFEIIILVPTYKQLFGGFLSLGMRYGGEAVFYQKKPSGRNITERQYSVTLIFLITKNVLGALPEFTSLITNDSYEFVGLLRGFATIAVLPVSVVWLVSMISYFSHVKKDSEFVKSLSNAYTEKLKSASQFYVARKLNIGILTFALAFALSFDVYLNYENILPDVLFYMMAFVGAYLLKNCSSKWKMTAVTSVVGVIASLAVSISSKNLFRLYEPNAIRRDIEAFALYRRMLVCYLAESVVFFVTSVLTLGIIWDAFKQHGDVIDVKTSTGSGTQRAYLAGAVLCVVFSFLSALGNMYYAISLQYHEKKWIFSYSSVIYSFLNLLFIFTVIYFTGAVRGSIKNRYKQYTDM